MMKNSVTSFHCIALFFRNDRKCNTKGGGVLLAVPKILSPNMRPDLCTDFEQTSFESKWVEYSSNGSGTKAVVAVLYNPF